MEGKPKDFFSQAIDIVGKGYSKISQDNYNSSENQLLDLLNHRSIPKDPFDKLTIY